MSEFHFAAARVCTAQICRAAGLERSVPSVLDALTDVLVQYLQLIGATAQKAAEARGTTISDVDDAMLAAVECSAVRGGLASTGLQTQRLSASTGIEDILELVHWLRSPDHRRQIAVAKPQRPLAGLIGAAQGAALAALPSSAAAASQFGLPPNNTAASIPTDPLSAGNPSVAVDDQQSQNAPPSSAGAPAPASLPPAETQDWLLMALNRQALMGHRDWFVNTELGPHTDPDPKIYG